MARLMHVDGDKAEQVVGIASSALVYVEAREEYGEGSMEASVAYQTLRRMSEEYLRARSEAEGETG